MMFSCHSLVASRFVCWSGNQIQSKLKYIPKISLLINDKLSLDTYTKLNTNLLESTRQRFASSSLRCLHLVRVRLQANVFHYDVTSCQAPMLGKCPKRCGGTLIRPWCRVVDGIRVIWNKIGTKEETWLRESENTRNASRQRLANSWPAVCALCTTRAKRWCVQNTCANGRCATSAVHVPHSTV